MKRFVRMIKRLAPIMLIVLSLTLTACATKRTSEAVRGEESRFVVIEQTTQYQVLYDRQTKVMYAMSDSPYSAGVFTVLVDANGNPLLYSKE